jgi:hypothetical protein
MSKDWRFRKAQVIPALSTSSEAAWHVSQSALWQVRGYDDDTFARLRPDPKAVIRRLAYHYEPRAIAWVETPSHMIDLLKQRYRWTRGILQAIKTCMEPLAPQGRANGFLLCTCCLRVICPVSTDSQHFFIWVGFTYGGATAYVLVAATVHPWRYDGSVLCHRRKRRHPAHSL